MFKKEGIKTVFMPMKRCSVSLVIREILTQTTKKLLHTH